MQLTALEFENVPALHDSQDDAPLSDACLPASDEVARRGWYVRSRSRVEVVPTSVVYHSPHSVHEDDELPLKVPASQGEQVVEFLPDHLPASV